jgi:hypothetical protein
MLIIPDYDSQALAAPQSFRDGIQAAINILDATFTCNITCKIAVGYGEAGAFGSLPDQNTSLGGPLSGVNISYSALRTDLLRTSDIDASSTSLPSGTSVNGVSSFEISAAQERLFGILPAVNNTSSDDGQIGMGTNFTGNVLIAGALHEFTHALGRIDGGWSMDIFRFSSPGTRNFDPNIPSTASYFSLDDGTTKLANFGRNSDPADFLNDALTTNDPFDEFVGSSPNLTNLDMELMDAIGFGRSQALSAPGNTVMIGDFTGTPDADIVWVTNGGTPIMWVMNGTKVASTATLPTPPPAAWHLSEVADFNGDGKSDLLWLNNINNTPSMWLMNGTSIVSSKDLPAPPTSWKIVGTGDFNGDGNADILWLNSDNTPSVWEMNGFSFLAAVALPAPPSSWTIVGTGDFYGNGHSDILWLNTNNTASIWEMNGTTLVAATALPAPPSSWHYVGTADFNGDHKADIMWQNSNGDVSIWEMNGANFLAAVDVGSPGAAWQLIGAGDFNGDGKSDLLFVNPTTEQVQIWLMNGTQVLSMTAPSSASALSGAQGSGAPLSSAAVLSAPDAYTAGPVAALPAPLAGGGLGSGTSGPLGVPAVASASALNLTTHA